MSADLVVEIVHAQAMRGARGAQPCVEQIAVQAGTRICHRPKTSIACQHCTLFAIDHHHSPLECCMSAGALGSCHKQIKQYKLGTSFIFETPSTLQ